MQNTNKALNEELAKIKEMMGLSEQEKKTDRCLKIARRKYDKPSAYRSGAIVRCRQGKIWKGLSESDINDAPQDVKDLIYKAHDAITRIKGRDYAPDVHELQAWIDNYLEKNGGPNIDENKERFQNIALDNLNSSGGFDKLKDIDKLALLGGTNDPRLKSLNLGKIYQQNGGTFGHLEIKVRVKDINQQPIDHKFSKEFAGMEGYLFSYIHHDSESDKGFVTVRFDEFNQNQGMYGGGTYEERPIMLDNIYPIDYDEIKSDFVDYQNKVDSERDDFRRSFDFDDIDEAKKTDYSKEKKSGLHGWFSRRGGGGSKGWVDCNTCKTVDGKKKCKACGRQKGEKRAKYPSCRPTPASCGTPGKGKKWGKTKNESINEANESPVKKVALLFIVIDNKVLLFKRSGKETTNPSKYGMLGGGIEKGESPQNAIKREVREEAGVTLTSFKPLKTYNYDGVKLHVFYTNTFPVDMIKLDKKEHTSHKFFTLEDVMNMADKEMIQSNKKIAKDYNKKVSKKKQLEEELNRITDMVGEDRSGYLKWKRANVTLRGVKEVGEENNAGAMLGRGLYTAALSNKSLAKEYGQVYFVLGAIPKNPKVFNTLNEWEIWFYNTLVHKYSKEKGNEYPDRRDFDANTTIEDEMMKMGYDGIVIKGREMVNFKPSDDVIYFSNEMQLENYYEFITNNALNEETFLGNHVWNHIVNITPNEDDIPWGFRKKIRNADFNVDNNFNLESLLNTDPDFKDYYESGDQRYGDQDEVNETDIYHDIVVVDGELLDGYSRAATLLRRGETRTSAFVGTNRL